MPCLESWRKHSVCSHPQLPQMVHLPFLSNQIYAEAYHSTNSIESSTSLLCPLTGHHHPVSSQSCHPWLSYVKTVSARVPCHGEAF